VVAVDLCFRSLLYPVARAAAGMPEMTTQVQALQEQQAKGLRVVRANTPFQSPRTAVRAEAAARAEPEKPAALRELEMAVPASSRRLLAATTEAVAAVVSTAAEM
jgi:hypothetical protein